MKTLLAPLMMAVLGLPCFTRLLTAADADKLEDALAEPVSIKIDQASLEMCLQAVEKKVRAARRQNDSASHPDFTIKILGDDLKREGVTRNQSIRNFEVTDKPAAEVLTDLVLRGYPSSDVTGPSDPRLKLIWIVGPHPDDADKLAILITTREGAKTRADKIPKVFQPKE
jgi:hypothetical protein